MVELGSQDLLVLLLQSSTIFKEVRRPLNQGLLPGMDLARVDFKPAGQLCNGVLPLERGQSHFGLEDWAVLLTCSLHVLLPSDDDPTDGTGYEADEDRVIPGNSTVVIRFRVQTDTTLRLNSGTISSVAAATTQAMAETDRIQPMGPARLR